MPRKLLYTVGFLLFVISLPFIGLGCFNREADLKEKNYNLDPPKNFTGNWIVYKQDVGLKWIEVEYLNGEKNCLETRWYPDTGYIMSQHSFKKNILDGKYIKWRNDKFQDVLVQGEYKDGKPWDGAFLEDWEFNLDTNLDVIERNVLYRVRFYKEGELIEQKNIS